MELAFASVTDLCSDFGNDLDLSLLHRLEPLSLLTANHDIAHAKGRRRR
jgi:hypothetical protein